MTNVSAFKRKLEEETKKNCDESDVDRRSKDKVELLINGRTKAWGQKLGGETKTKDWDQELGV